MSDYPARGQGLRRSRKINMNDYSERAQMLAGLIGWASEEARRLGLSRQSEILQDLSGQMQNSNDPKLD